MTKSAVYPKAIFANNGVSGGSYTSGPPKLVIHTTETSGMPGYNNGLSSPHLTYDPRSRLFVQHRTFKEAARALRNEAGGVQTNRDTALQIELICYSSKPLADQQPYRDWVGDLDKIPGALEDLAEFIDWVCDDWGIEKTWPGRQALSYSAANKSGFRLTPAEWDSFNGVCGHQHVPENTHWDPGAIDWKQLPLEDDMPLNAEDLAAIKTLLEEKIGPTGVITDANGNPRPFHQFTVNGVWHATAAGKRMMDHVIAPTPVDEAAVAASVVAAMTPGLQAAVAAELKKITLKAE